MKQYLKEKISQNQIDLKTAIVLNKAMRSFKPYETKAAKEHGLTLLNFPFWKLSIARENCVFRI